MWRVYSSGNVLDCVMPHEEDACRRAKEIGGKYYFDDEDDEDDSIEADTDEMVVMHVLRTQALEEVLWERWTIAEDAQ